MANKSIVSNTKLDAIANAIKAKDSSATTPMTLDQMATAIANIPSGGGVNLADMIDDSASGTFTISDNNITTIRKNFWRDCSRLEAVSFPSVKTVKDNAFQYASKLRSIYLPACEEIKNNAFYGVKMASITLPAIKNIAYDVFNYCSALTTVDLGTSLQQIQGNAFQNCTHLTTLIIRNTSAVVTLGSSVFNYSAIASGTGYIYVPDSLVSSYQGATNWSAYASQIKGLSELPTA